MQEPNEDPFTNLMTKLMLDQPSLKIRSLCLESYPCYHSVSKDGVTWQLLGGCEIKEQMVSMNLISHSAYKHFVGYKTPEKIGEKFSNDNQQT